MQLLILFFVACRLPFFAIVPRLPDFSLDVDRIVEEVKQNNPKCIFLTSPNNPDGRYIFVIQNLFYLAAVRKTIFYWITFYYIYVSVINDEDLLKILDLPILLVLDEAYIEFSSLQSRMSWVKKHDNLIVLRTFSKRAGLWFIFLFLLVNMYSEQCNDFTTIWRCGFDIFCPHDTRF